MHRHDYAAIAGSAHSTTHTLAYGMGREASKCLSWEPPTGLVPPALCGRIPTTNHAHARLRHGSMCVWP